MATNAIAASPINMQDFLRILVAQLNYQDPAQADGQRAVRLPACAVHLAAADAEPQRQDGRSADGSSGGGTTQTGTGVTALASFINFKDGDVRQTGNPLDMSIDGEGFFVTRDATDGSTTYTRTGQFGFDKGGLLISAPPSAR